MTEPPNDRLQQILGSPLLEPLVHRLARRLARKPEVIGLITLSKLSTEQADAVRALIGADPSDSDRVRVDLAQLQNIVKRSGAARSLIDAVESLTGGSLVDHIAEREAARAAWLELPETVEEFDQLPNAVRNLIVRSCENGSLRSLSNNDLTEAKRILQTTAAALQAMPLMAALPLPVFAQTMTGDSHAFDSSTLLGRFLVRCIAAKAGFDPSRCDSIEQRRQIWGSVDVVLDELSSTVLLLNLPGSSDSLSDQTLRQHAEAGEPLRLTFRQLRVSRPTFEGFADRSVFVCENPSVVTMAADTHGPQSAPLICTDGVPSHAVTTLLGQLVESGANLHCHTDLDWAGIRIAMSIIARHGAEAWRMSDEDYSAAIAGRALKGKPVETPWCPALKDAMTERGKAVLEEEVAELLIGDLGTHTRAE